VVHYYWSAAAGWAAEDLTALYAGRPRPGPPTLAEIVAKRIAGDPVAVNLVSGGVPTQHVFGRHGSGSVIHYYWSAAAGWAGEDLTALYAGRPRPGPATADEIAARRIAGAPVVLNLRSGAEETQHVFGRHRSSGDLIHYYWSAFPGWAAENLTLRAQPAPGSPAVIPIADKRLVGDPVAINVLDIRGVPTQHVFGRTAAGGVVHYFWRAADGWQVENLTTRYATAASAISSDPVVVLLYDGLLPRLRLYGRRGLPGDVIGYTERAFGWTAANLTTEPTDRIASRPVIPGDLTLAAEVVGRSSNGSIIRYCAGTC
jgi:hypothetical protein